MHICTALAHHHLPDSISGSSPTVTAVRYAVQHYAAKDGPAVGQRQQISWCCCVFDMVDSVLLVGDTLSCWPQMVCTCIAVHVLFNSVATAVPSKVHRYMRLVVV